MDNHERYGYRDGPAKVDIVTEAILRGLASQLRTTTDAAHDDMRAGNYEAAVVRLAAVTLHAREMLADLLDQIDTTVPS